jgi:succinoglycan biosynthesis protein ExoV
MRLYYWRGEYPNFGDELNPWLFSRLLPGLIDHDPSVLFLAIGTILNHGVPQEPHKIVFSSGVGYGEPPAIGPTKWSFVAVRGPLTAKVLGLPPEMAVTDGAVLLRTLIPRGMKKIHRASFMPHRLNAVTGPWDRVCQETGLHLIDPRGSVEEVVEDIASSEFVLAEAMHGAIVADALRVPWIPIRAHRLHHDFKWQDWCASIKVTYRPQVIPNLDREEFLAQPFSRTVDAAKRCIRMTIRRRAAAGEPYADYAPLPTRVSPVVNRLVRQGLIRVMSQRLPLRTQQRLDRRLFEACCAGLQGVDLNTAQLSQDDTIERQTDIMVRRLRTIPAILTSLQPKRSGTRRTLGASDAVP